MKRKLLVTLLILSAIFNSMTAFATTVTTVTNAAGLKNAITEKMINREKEFDIHYVGTETAVLSNINTIINEAAYADKYLELAYIGETPEITGNDTDFSLSIRATYRTTKEQEDFVDAKVKEIVSKYITSNMTENQKLQVIYQYIIDNVAYDYSLMKGTAYNALVDRKAVCAGYAMLFQKLANTAGFECEIVIGRSNDNGILHAWNLIKTGGSWYNVDVTSDDCNSNRQLFAVSESTLAYHNVTRESESKDLPRAESCLEWEDLTPIAASAVKKAEFSKLQEDVDVADVLVNAIYTLRSHADLENKQALKNRLAIVQTSIDNSKNIEKAANNAVNAVT